MAGSGSEPGRCVHDDGCGGTAEGRSSVFIFAHIFVDEIMPRLPIGKSPVLNGKRTRSGTSREQALLFIFYTFGESGAKR